MTHAATHPDEGGAWPPGSLAPAPAAASRSSMLAAQARLEVLLTVRRGESVLLTLIIPIVLLVVLSQVDVLDLPSDRVGFLVPGILALAVLSTAFTGQAIATGFERSYGVLKRLGATALPRGVLLAGKTAAVALVELVQVLVVVLVGLLLGWSPPASGVGWAVLMVVLGTAAFSALGLLMAGALRAEVTLAAANLVYLVLLLVGGVLFPVTAFGDGAATALRLLPVTALSDSLRTTLTDGAGPGVGPIVVLVVWALAAGGLAARTFRWE